MQINIEDNNMDMTTVSKENTSNPKQLYLTEPVSRIITQRQFMESIQKMRKLYEEHIITTEFYLQFLVLLETFKVE